MRVFVCMYIRVRACYAVSICTYLCCVWKVYVRDICVAGYVGLRDVPVGMCVCAYV